MSFVDEIYAIRCGLRLDSTFRLAASGVTDRALRLKHPCRRESQAREGAWREERGRHRQAAPDLFGGPPAGKGIHQVNRGYYER